MFNTIKSQIEHIGEEQRYLGSDWKAAQYRLLDYYARILPRVFNVERCGIFVADHDGGANWLTAGTGLPQRDLSSDKLANAIVGETIRTGKSIYRTNLEQNDHFDQEVVGAATSSVRDVMCMPFRSLDGTNITGAVQLVNRKDGSAYSDDDEDLLADMLHRLEISMESIYFRQEAGGVVGRTYRVLRRITIVGLLVFFAILVAFTLYWFGGTFIGMGD